MLINYLENVTEYSTTSLKSVLTKNFACDTLNLAYEEGRDIVS